jgi:hypothetical protein
MPAPAGERARPDYGLRLALAVPVLFLALGLWRAAPFVDDVSPATSVGDDWLSYKRWAESVLRDGWSIPALPGAYAVVPRGFLYVYFVAGVFAVAGVNSSFVYVAQSALLGAAVTLWYVAFRRRLAPGLGMVLLAGLTLLAFVDFFRALTFRLLSENLFVVVAALFWCLLPAGPAWRRSRLFWAGLVLGLSVLARPSTIMAAAAVAVVLGAHSVWTRRDWMSPLVFCLGALLGVGPAILRDFASTGELGFRLVSDTRDWNRIWEAPAADFLATLGSRAAFAFGWTSLMVPDFRIRPHWMLLWAGTALFCWRRLRSRAGASWWDAALVLYVACFIGPVVLVADITSYGGRMIVIVLPMLLYLSLRAVEDTGVAARIVPRRDAARVPERAIR